MDVKSDVPVEDIQPPTELLLQLKPDRQLSVGGFLHISPLSYPAVGGSGCPAATELSWFSKQELNEIPDAVGGDLALPPPNICETLDGLLREATSGGYLSVRHPVKDNIFLLLWVPRGVPA